MTAGYIGRTIQVPLHLAGLQHPRNTDLLGETALIDGTVNVDFHEFGLGKRGGSDILISGFTGEIRGVYQFKLKSGTTYILVATSEGKVFHTSAANLLVSGMSTNNFFHFMTFNDETYFCDGASAPRYWSGGAAVAVTPAATWSSAVDWPFMLVSHSRGGTAGPRLWAICRGSVWASPQDGGHDFSSAVQIPVYLPGGLKGAFEFNGTLFVYSETKMVMVDDTDIDENNWGYQDVIWDGGCANFRLSKKVANNMVFVTKEGHIFDLRGVQTTGDYEAQPISLPANISRWIREKVSLNNIENFHCAHDRKRRCLVFFFQVAGSVVNTGLTYFYDRPPAIAWVVHDNENYESGFRATCSAEAEISVGDYRIITGDNLGRIWVLGASNKDDNGNPYKAGFKTKRLNHNQPLLWKHFQKARINVAASGNFNLVIRWWVDGKRKTDINLSVSGSGAMFDAAYFDSSVFAKESIEPWRFKLGAFGYDIQFEVFNETTGEDFFAALLEADYESCGGR